MKRRLSWIACIWFVGMLLPLSALGEAPMCSITEVAEQARNGWHQTYEAYGRTIIINVDFTVPEVTEMPILVVRWGNYDITSNDSSEDLQELYENGFGFSRNSPLDAPRGKTQDITDDQTYLAEPWDFSRVYVENSSFTLWEAVSFSQKKLAAFSDGLVQLAPEYFSAIAIRKRVNGYPEGPAIGKGYYRLEFRQLIRGIPIMGGIQMTMAPGPKVTGSGYPSPTAYIASNEEYVIGACYMVEVEQVHADVPLCPLTVMIEQLEELITSGHLRSIDSIRLGYVLYLDRNNKERFLAFPAWVIRTSHYFATAKEELPEEIQGRPLDSFYHSQDPIVFNAQTGEMVEVYTRNLDVINCPQIITWDGTGRK